MRKGENKYFSLFFACSVHIYTHNNINEDVFLTIKYWINIRRELIKQPPLRKPLLSSLSLLIRWVIFELINLLCQCLIPSFFIILFYFRTDLSKFLTRTSVLIAFEFPHVTFKLTMKYGKIGNRNRCIHTIVYLCIITLFTHLIYITKRCSYFIFEFNL